MVESPFHALDAPLLVLLGVFGGEGHLRDAGPVLTPVEIQQSEIAKEQADI